MSTPIDSFIDYVMPDVNQCPVPSIEKAVRQTLIEFCQKTWILQEAFNWRITETDVSEEFEGAFALDFNGIYYSLQYEPVRVLFLAVDGTPIDLVDRRDIEEINGWEDDTSSTPTDWYVINSHVIHIYPKPTDEFDLYCRVAFKPKRDATIFWDELYNEWIDTIAAGAKFRLFQIPNKPWTNPELVMVNKALFDKGLSAGKIRVRALHLPPSNFKKGWI